MPKLLLWSPEILTDTSMMLCCVFCCCCCFSFLYTMELFSFRLFFLNHFQGYLTRKIFFLWYILSEMFFSWNFDEKLLLVCLRWTEFWVWLTAWRGKPNLIHWFAFEFFTDRSRFYFLIKKRWKITRFSPVTAKLFLLEAGEIEKKLVFVIINHFEDDATWNNVEIEGKLCLEVRRSRFREMNLLWRNFKLNWETPARKPTRASNVQDHEQGYEGKGRREGQEKALFPNFLGCFEGAEKLWARAARESFTNTRVITGMMDHQNNSFSLTIRYLRITPKSTQTFCRPRHSNFIHKPCKPQRRRISARKRERLGVQESQGLILRICSTREFSTKKPQNKRKDKKLQFQALMMRTSKKFAGTD